VLDPRIGYAGLRDDYSDDLDLLDGLEQSKVALESHFNQFYAGCASLASTNTTPQSSVADLSSNNPQPHDFTARFRKRPKPLQNELEEFFSLFPQDFMSCNPVQWWYANRNRFPNLYRLARDILAIPCQYEHTYIGHVNLDLYTLYQDQQLLWNKSFLEEETPFHCDAPVSNPTLSVFSC
jgi:hypothetical protein